MILLKLATRSNLKTFYNPIKGLLFGQCKDNKVVSFISMQPLVGNDTTMQQCESNNISSTCPKALQAYNTYMGYVDLVDFDKKLEDLLLKKVVSRNGTRKAILE